MKKIKTMFVTVTLFAAITECLISPFLTRYNAEYRSAYAFFLHHLYLSAIWA